MSFEQLKELISDISKVPLSEIHEHSSFKNDLDIDSLQMVHLILEISTKFSMELKNIQSNNDLLTVGNLYLTLYRG